MPASIFSDYFIFWIAAAAVLVMAGLDLLGSLRYSSPKKISVIILSAGLILWLDPLSLVLLTAASSLLFTAIKKRWRFPSHIGKITIASLVLLVLVKDGVRLFAGPVYVPLGVSFYFFRLISLAVDYSRDPDFVGSLAPLDYFAWVFFFPIFLAGPIQRFGDFQQRTVPANEKARLLAVLFFAFMGKVVLVDGLLKGYVYGPLALEVRPGLPTVTPLLLFGFGFLAFLHAYLDLMFYTEISNSLSGILGFTHQVNFRRPLLASNIAAFWQRYHISLSSWVRDYIYFPTLVNTRQNWLATYVSMLVMGLWHATGLVWLTWALAHGTALNIYNAVRKLKVFKKCAATRAGNYIMTAGGIILTIVFVSLVFIFIARNDFEGTILIFQKVIERRLP